MSTCLCVALYVGLFVVETFIRAVYIHEIPVTTADCQITFATALVGAKSDLFSTQTTCIQEWCLGVRCFVIGIGLNIVYVWRRSSSTEFHNIICACYVSL